MTSFLHVVPLTHPLFLSLEAAGSQAMSLARARELSWLYRPGRATGWGYGSVNEGKHIPERLPYTLSCEQPGACPGWETRKPQPRESPKSSFKKNGRAAALKRCTAVSYLRKCVKGSARLPQGLSPVIKYIWFQSTCRKTTLKFLALFRGFCSTPAPRSSAEEEGSLLAPLLNFSFSATFECVSNSVSQNPISSLQDKCKRFESSRAAVCVWVCRNSISQAHPCCIPSYTFWVDTLWNHNGNRKVPPAYTLLCDFPDAWSDTTLIKKLAEIGAQNKGRFCVGVGM